MTHVPKLNEQWVFRLGVIALIICIAAAMLYMAFMMRSHRIATSPKDARDAGVPMPVQVQTAELSVADISVTSDCTSEANPHLKIYTQLKRDLKVIDTPFSEGDIVEEGDLLIKLDGEEIETTLDSLSAQEKTLVEQLEARQWLVDYYRDNRKEGLSLEAQYRQAIIELHRTEVEIKALMHDFAQAEIELGYTEVRAPFPGVLTEVSPVGTIAVSRETIIGLARTDPLKISCYFNEDTLGKFNKGDSVDIAFQALPSREFTAIVTHMDAIADAETRRYTLFAALENPNFELIPGLAAIGRIHKPHEAIWIPAVALVNPGREYGQIFAVKDGKAELKRVAVGSYYNSRVEIIDGISPGEQIVVVGQLYLLDGDPVNVIQDD